MCGVMGVVCRDAANQAIHDGLTMLQHRGQEAAGIVTCEGDRLFLRKNNGFVRDVFHSHHMLRLRGSMGIGHVRYSTVGGTTLSEAQPFYVNSPYGIVLAHNGQLVNSAALKRELYESGLRHINTSSDSEVLLNVLADELQRRNSLRLEIEDVFAAVSALHRRCRGGYSVVALIAGYGMLAFRDPHGIRPAIFGRRGDGEYAVASESVALDILGYERMRDLAPGEAIFVSADGKFHARACASPRRHTPCIFEYVYLARPDSILDGVLVYKARLRMGEALAEKILRKWPERDIDVVIPVPDTGRTTALPLSYRLGVKYREGFVKNRYIPRTFIMPGQAVRQKSVRQKLNVIDLEFADKNVLLVDDSIVRGTTAREIVSMARGAGARKVYFASAAPPVRYPNVYGIDIPTQSELVAYRKSEDEAAAAIGADRLFYQDLEDLEAAVLRSEPGFRAFDSSCFDGKYVTGGVRPDSGRDVPDRRAVAGERDEQEPWHESRGVETLVDFSGNA